MLVLAIPLIEFNAEDIYFMETGMNHLFENGYYTKFIYSNSLFKMNGVTTDTQIDPANFTDVGGDNICSSVTLHALGQIEYNILQKYSVIMQVLNKSPIYKLSNNLINGRIKLDTPSLINYYSHNNGTKGVTLLKISGVWETATNYGLSYKFIVK